MINFKRKRLDFAELYIQSMMSELFQVQLDQLLCLGFLMLCNLTHTSNRNITTYVTLAIFLSYIFRLLVSRALTYVGFTKIQLISLSSPSSLLSPLVYTCVFLLVCLSLCLYGICLCFEITNKLQDGNKGTYPLPI